MNNIFANNITKCGFLLFITLLMLNACSFSPSDEEKQRQAIAEAQPIYASNALRIDVLSDARLNEFNYLPNSCTILVAQVEKRENLDTLLNNPILLRSLFSSNGVAAGILQLDSYVMLPGQRVSLHVDRAENARYFAIIAGYYPEPNRAHSRVFSFPLRLTEEGWWNTTWTATFINMQVNLVLGRNTIIRTQVLAGNKDDKIVFPERSAMGADSIIKIGDMGKAASLFLLSAAGDTLNLPKAGDALNDLKQGKTSSSFADK